MLINVASKIQTLSESIPEIEAILLWNLTPGSYDEAVTLIPSLRERDEGAVRELVEFINKNKI